MQQQFSRSARTKNIKYQINSTSSNANQGVHEASLTSAAADLAFNFNENFVDSHCHLDLLLWESYLRFRSEVVASTHPKNFGGCIAVFAHPYNYDTGESFAKVCSLLEEEGVFGSIGCHPKCAPSWSENLESTIRRLVASSEDKKVVAIGECGLDYSQHFGSTSHLQKRVFINQIKLAVELKLPLVVHCRDAEEDCFEVMTSNLPHDHPVHRHCFTATASDLKKWMYAFPNMSFGFTPSVLFNNKHTNEVLKEIPLDRVLLETDAPYFLPQAVKKARSLNNCSHPGLAIFVAMHIASLKNIDVEEVLRQTFANTCRVYSGAKFGQPNAQSHISNDA